MSDLQQRLQQITFIVTDVDGVLTDGRMWFDGEGEPFLGAYPWHQANCALRAHC